MIIMYKGKSWCRNCEQLNDFEFESHDDLPKVCMKCKSDDIFYQQIDWGNDNPPVNLHLGNGGCGGYRRT